MRDKILKKIREGDSYITINPDRDKLYCPKCGEILVFESSPFVGRFFCENIDCKFFSKRYRNKQRLVFGGITFYNDEIRKFLKHKEGVK